MLFVRKIDLYILKKFLPLFLGAFFICLFVFMMQFTWRYIDELIGKGLSVDILAQFFFHMGVTLVPMSLPLAVLLASLITFGNMGEQLELLSMKAAGISLLRIMRPVMLIVVILTGYSFYFQNSTAPEAQIKLRTLLVSMKQQSPAVEIPEGVFYSGVPNVNLFVQTKNAETGMLYQLIIYKTDRGFDRAQIVLADSGRMEMTADKLHLILDLWSGEQFENLQQRSASALSSSGVPYDRETFGYKRFIIDFDSNFALMDANMLRDMPSAKSMREITTDIDSMEHAMDSVGRTYYAEAKGRWLSDGTHEPAAAQQTAAAATRTLQKGGKVTKAKQAAQRRAPVPPFGELLKHIEGARLQGALRSARTTAQMYQTDLEWKSVVTSDGDRFIRRHLIEWHQKMTLALSCLFFFFVGAPLGAIIRKGGLGMPAVVSVLIFIFYYIVNTSGMKMARDGEWNMVFGMWLSSAILIPFGVFLTYKSNRDSVVFNAELYANALRRLLGLRTHRHLVRKEVVIDAPDYDRLPRELQALRETCLSYSAENRLILAPNYIATFFRHRSDHRIAELSDRLEALVEELSNARSSRLIAELNTLPLVYANAHVSPFDGHRANVASGVFFPLGCVLYLRIWRFRLRLLRDLKQIVASSERLEALIAEEKVRVQRQA